MSVETLTVIGEIILVPILTFLTMWLKNSNQTQIRRDKRDDGYINTLEARVKALEDRLDAKEKEMREIHHELKNRDQEYITLYQEHTTMKAKYEVLQNDHNALKKDYDATVAELNSIRETIKVDREKTAEIAGATAQAVTS